MTNPPRKLPSQKGYIHTAVRLPPDLTSAVKESAEANGRSFNAEVIARLQRTELEAVLTELAELKLMVKKVIDRS
jgi:hypothetical protein